MRSRCSSAAVYRVVAWIVALLFLSPLARAEENAPTGDEVAALMADRPMTLEEWPFWREQLLRWIDLRSQSTDQPFKAARALMATLAGENDQLPPSLSNDYFTWYLLGRAHLDTARDLNAAEKQPRLARAIAALKKSRTLKEDFARVHLALAMGMMELRQLQQPPADQPSVEEIDAAFRRCRELDPKTRGLAYIQGVWLLMQKKFGNAEPLLLEAYREVVKEPSATPEERTQLLHLALVAIMANDQNPNKLERLDHLITLAPDEPMVRANRAVALYNGHGPLAAYRAMAALRREGIDPGPLLFPGMIQAFDDATRYYRWADYFLRVMIGFAIIYAVVTLSMAAAGFVLAARTRAPDADDLMSQHPDKLAHGGRAVLTHGESSLSRWYGLALFMGLILFYVAVPFMLAGILGGAALVTWLITLTGRIPIKLVVFLAVVALMSAWGILKGLFSRLGGPGGIPLDLERAPGLRQLLHDVARDLETDPVDEVYLVPGCEIGVMQVGRGPFGVFGVKKRSLMLGVASIKTLSVGELRSILAHEYAHFSHRDTFISRFIGQVTAAIEQSLTAMGQAAGQLNYINPFYWMLAWYYRAYVMLSAGYMRSREFLADRLSAATYGSDVFGRALTRVATDAAAVEQLVFEHCNGRLNEGATESDNAYASIEAPSAEMIEKQRESLVDSPDSLFSTHPSYRERMAAVLPLPPATNRDDAPASTLFHDPVEVENEASSFIYAILLHARQMSMAT